MGRAVKQGDIYWYTFRAPDKRRPVLILTRDSAIPYLTGLTVAPVTTNVRDIPTEVVLTPADGMPADCAVNLDNIQTIRKAGLGADITHLSPALMREVRAGVEFALGFDALQ